MDMPSTNPNCPLSSSSSRQSLYKDASRPGTASSPPGHHSSGQRPESLSADQAYQQPISITSPYPDATVNHVEDCTEEQQYRHSSHPPFQPFFTLIEDAHTSDYHHPTVHYIFSDDDSDIVTEAALRSLFAQQESLSDSKKGQLAHTQGAPQDEIKDTSASGPAKTALLPPSVPSVRENYIILDVEPSPITEPREPIPEQLAPGRGDTKSLSSSPANLSALPQESQSPYRVTAAQSFSSAWQVLNTEVAPAPTFENSNPGDSPGHGLMLKIRGTAGLPDEKGRDGVQSLEEMMDQFAKRMSELQVVIDAAEAAGSNAQADRKVHPVSTDGTDESAPKYDAYDTRMRQG